MSYWNHRVFAHTHTDSGERRYEIHEAYYTDDGRLYAHTARSVPPYGESLEELRETLQMMLRATEQPVLTATLD